MDFQLSDEQSLLRDTTRDLLARSYDPDSRNKVLDTDLGWSRDVWSQLADIGNAGEVAGQTRGRIPLERTRRIDLFDLVVVQQVVQRVLLQPLAEQRRQADDRTHRKTVDDPLLHGLPMAAHRR